MSDDLVEENDKQTELMSQALPVAKISEINLKEPPVSGEDYLTRVRLEASKNAIVVAKNVDVKKFEKNRTPQFESECSNNHKFEQRPSKEWQNEKCLEFSLLRERVVKERENFLVTNDKVDKKSLNIPTSKNKKEWYTFCLGKGIGLKKQTSTSEAVERGHEPSLTILYSLDQTTIVRLFDFLVEWTVENDYSRQAFEWLYSLMCFLEKPLLPETHSSLRDLARSCIRMRSQLNNPSQNDDKLVELNFFITLIGRYFQQYDLADNDD